MPLGEPPRPPVGDQLVGQTSEPRSRFPFSVDLGNGEMGLQTDRFNLSGMFASAHDQDFNGSGRADTVYFRTRSGNIYRLDTSGLLVDGNQSKKWKSPIVVHLDPYDMEDAEDMIVGTDFRYPIRKSGVRHTTRITEIVVTSKEMKTKMSMTHGRKSSIARDFYEDLPEISPIETSV